MSEANLPWPHLRSGALKEIPGVGGFIWCWSWVSRITGVSTLHDIDAFRCSVAEISDNLAGNKRLTMLIISILHKKIAARSYEKIYNLAGVLMIYLRYKHLITNTLHPTDVTKSFARLSEIKSQHYTVCR